MSANKGPIVGHVSYDEATGELNITHYSAEEQARRNAPPVEAEVRPLTHAEIAAQRLLVAHNCAREPEEWRTRHETTKAWLATIDARDERIAELTAGFNALRHNLAHADDLRKRDAATIATLQQKLAAAEAERQTMVAALAEWQRTATETHAALIAERDALQSQVREAEERRKDESHIVRMLVKGWEELAPLVGYTRTETDELYEIVRERLEAYPKAIAERDKLREELIALRNLDNKIIREKSSKGNDA
jgi:chromosome segregation ATPase